MVGLRSSSLRLAVALISILGIGGCGGHKPAGQSPFVTKVNLLPSNNMSVQLGSTFNFTGTAQNNTGSSVSTSISFTSSDTSIMNVAPNGAACAGEWNGTYTVCTPGNYGTVLVTAVAAGVFSPPTLVFVHPPIDNVVVHGVLLNNVPIQEPCLSQGQSMSVQAQAFSQGVDITSAVGPFTWTANNPSVVKITPILNDVILPNFNENIATNQATITAFTPGITQIYATASGYTSTLFDQPQYQNAQGTTSPPLDFFETCPIQNITLEVGYVGSQQTSFVATTSSSGNENVIATITDVMGNSSLPNTDGGVVLTKVPLTWTASQPAAVGLSTACTQSCNATVKSPGAGTVTASCSPPTCNVGFPYVPVALSSPTALATCAQFFQLPSCVPFIPAPVYATTAVSGLVTPSSTGSPAPATVLATSTGCSAELPSVCSTALYSVSTSKDVSGNPNGLPAPPNSVLFDPAGIKAYMGSEFGALQVNPGNLNSSSSAFSPLGAVTGNVLAVSNNSNVAVFSDTIHTPNQVYVVNTSNSNSTAITALNITNASTAGFSPDGLKTFIVGNNGTSLYIYSPLQALQQPSASTPQLTLSGPATGIAFTPNSAFAYVAEGSANGSQANLTAFGNCNNEIAGSVPLPASPILTKVLAAAHIGGTDSNGYSIPDGVHVLLLDGTGFDVVTSTITSPPLGTLTNPGTLCPQTLTFVSNDPARPAQRIEMNQGTIHPINFFTSADGSLIYVLASDRSSILVYDFATGAWGGGIPLRQTGASAVTPLVADMTADSTTIVLAGSDGMLHEISTAFGGSDQFQLPFPNLSNFVNPFCTFTPEQGPCILNQVIARP